MKHKNNSNGDTNIVRERKKENIKRALTKSKKKYNNNKNNICLYNNKWFQL